MIITTLMLVTPADLICLSCWQSFQSHNGVHEWTGGKTCVTSWNVSKIIIRLMWHVSWDVINAIDNQCLGIKSKASSMVK